MNIEELLSFATSIEGQGFEDEPKQVCTYTSFELRLITNCLLELPLGSRVVEIGVYGGRSTSLLFQLQKEFELDIHLIDNWSWDAVRALRIFTTMVLEHFSEVPFTLHKMRSDYAGEFKWRDPIAFLHIDGWHEMPGIESDCRLFLPWVIQGGTVAFHDCDYPPVQECIDKYVIKEGWRQLESAGRTTTWRKP